MTERDEAEPNQAEHRAKMARIKAAKDAALGEIEGVAAEAASAAVRRLTGIEVAGEEARATVARVLREAA